MADEINWHEQYTALLRLAAAVEKENEALKAENARLRAAQTQRDTCPFCGGAETRMCLTCGGEREAR